eukprot:46922-Eustigmatos_ZCMA.PRE.1
MCRLFPVDRQSRHATIYRALNSCVHMSFMSLSRGVWPGEAVSRGDVPRLLTRLPPRHTHRK